jgi:hypothetical protein
MDSRLDLGLPSDQNISEQMPGEVWKTICPVESTRRASAEQAANDGPGPGATATAKDGPGRGSATGADESAPRRGSRRESAGRLSASRLSAGCLSAGRLTAAQRKASNNHEQEQGDGFDHGMERVGMFAHDYPNS